MSEEPAFEKALEKLEKIVEELEAGNVSLEEALKKYEEGVKLSAICQKRLALAEKKIEVLSRAMDGSFKKEAFDPEAAEENEGKAAKKSPRSQTRAPKSDEDEDLLI